MSVPTFWSRWDWADLESLGAEQHEADNDGRRSQDSPLCYRHVLNTVGNPLPHPLQRPANKIDDACHVSIFLSTNRSLGFRTKHDTWPFNFRDIHADRVKRKRFFRLCRTNRAAVRLNLQNDEPQFGSTLSFRSEFLPLRLTLRNGFCPGNKGKNARPTSA